MPKKRTRSERRRWKPSTGTEDQPSKTIPRRHTDATHPQLSATTARLNRGLEKALKRAHANLGQNGATHATARAPQATTSDNAWHRSVPSNDTRTADASNERRTTCLVPRLEAPSNSSRPAPLTPSPPWPPASAASPAPFPGVRAARSPAFERIETALWPKTCTRHTLRRARPSAARLRVREVSITTRRADDEKMPRGRSNSSPSVGPSQKAIAGGAPTKRHARRRLFAASTREARPTAWRARARARAGRAR